MKNRKALTLLDVVVAIVIIIVLLAIFMPLFNRVEKHPPGQVCGVNLKGLGTAMIVYANDYDDNFPELPGEGPWAKELGFDYATTRPEFGRGGEQAQTGRPISASWYLLVRETDVSPKSFVCPSSSQVPFGGENPQSLDITELWDFGGNPYKHVSYSMHNPYGKFPADGTRSAAFAVAGDMSPWFLDGDIVSPGKNGEGPQLIGDDWSINAQVEKMQIQAANSSYHDHEGQNVVYGDGHRSYEKRSDVGVRHDGIYTYQSGGDIRIGKNPTGRDEGNDAISREDSFLGI